MALTGLPFLIMLAGAAAVVVALTMALWNRWPRWWANPLRLLSLLLVMLLGIGLAADMVNRNFDFYSSFGDLFGHVSATGPAVALPVQDFGTQNRASRVVRVQLAGARSHLNRYALVYLPAAYFQRSQARRRFPVSELFHGYPGNPVNWFNGLHVARVLDAEIADGQMPPLIAVAPTDNDVGRDSECVNAVRGEQDDTYLGVEVPALIQRDFRTLREPHSWATIGYSTGGFCAVNIALHHPSLYGAAASLSGYFTPLVNRDTGDLYLRDVAARLFNTPVWVVRHERVDLPLYLVASLGDPSAVRAMQDMRQVAGHRMPVVTVTLPSGGHNFHVWYAASLTAIPWLAAHLPPPVDSSPSAKPAGVASPSA